MSETWPNKSSRKERNFLPNRPPRARRRRRELTRSRDSIDALVQRWETQRSASKVVCPSVGRSSTGFASCPSLPHKSQRRARAKRWGCCYPDLGVSLSSGRYSSVPNGAALCTLERHHSHPARETAANHLPALSGTTARQAQPPSEKIFGDSCSRRGTRI